MIVDIWKPSPSIVVNLNSHNSGGSEVQYVRSNHGDFDRESVNAYFGS